MTHTDSVLRGLTHPDPSVRLRSALAVGSAPDERLLPALVERCATEPEFEVREMLTWALTRLPPQLTVPALVAQLTAVRPQARSQALHTLSKIADPAVWPSITPALLTDPDDEVARAAWRVAAALAPDDARPALARVLVTQLGRGGPQVRLSLSRALAALGETAEPLLTAVRDHADFTVRLRHDPDLASGAALAELARTVAPC